MKNYLLLGMLFAATNLHAQDETIKGLKKEATREIKKQANDTLVKTWRTGGIFSINISQGTLSNWAAGGDNYSLSVNNLISLFAFFKKQRHYWDNTLDFNYGIVNTTSLGSRKNDDRFDLLSKYGFDISPKWSLTFLGNFRTQFFKGYSYKNNLRTLSSDFFAPAYLLLGVGLDYKPDNTFSLYLSPVTTRFTFVRNDSLSAKGAYGVQPGDHTKSEVGAFLSAGYLKVFNKVLSYKGRLDLFSNYKHRPQNIDGYMTNVLSIKFTKVLSATWNVDLIYDDDVRLFGPNKTSPALQVKSLIGIGLLLKLGNGSK